MPCHFQLTNCTQTHCDAKRARSSCTSGVTGRVMAVLAEIKKNHLRGAVFDHRRVVYDSMPRSGLTEIKGKLFTTESISLVSGALSLKRFLWTRLCSKLHMCRSPVILLLSFMQWCTWVTSTWCANKDGHPLPLNRLRYYIAMTQFCSVSVFYLPQAAP